MSAAAATREPIRLRRQALSSLPHGIRAPAYDVSAVRPGILHLGLGGFHRAHMARYTHELMQLDPEALRFGIVGTGLREPDESLLDRLARQDGLYCLLERSGSEETASVIGSLTQLIYGGA